MSAPNRVDELRKRYHENPRRFFAPLANEYRKTGFVDRAILLCEKHLFEQPGNMNGLVVYGQCLVETGRLDEARQPFESALGLDPENLIALRNLGDIARLSGDAPTARTWYEKLLEVDRRNDEVIALLAEVGGGPDKAPSSASQAPNIISVAGSVRVTTATDTLGMIDLDAPAAAPATAPAAAPAPTAAAPTAPSTPTVPIVLVPPAPIREISPTPRHVPAMVDPSAKTVEVSAQPRPAKRASLLDVNFDFGEAGDPAESAPPPPPEPLLPAEAAEYGFAAAELGSSAEEEIDTLDSFLESLPSEPARVDAVAPSESLMLSPLVEASPEGEPLAALPEVEGIEKAEFSADVAPLAGLEASEFGGGDAARMEGLDPMEFSPPDRPSSMLDGLESAEFEPLGLEAAPEPALGVTHDDPFAVLPAVPPADATPAGTTEDETPIADEPAWPVGLEEEQEDARASARASVAGLPLLEPFGTPTPMATPTVPELPLLPSLEEAETVPINLESLRRSMETPSTFVTETMAQVYVQQGHTDKAIEVYRQLVAQTPDDSGLASRLRALETPAAPAVSAAPATPAAPPPVVHDRASLGFDTPLTSDPIEEAAPANAMLKATSFDGISLSTPETPARAAATVPAERASVATGPSAREFFSRFAHRALTPVSTPVTVVGTAPSAAGRLLSPLDELFGSAVAPEDEAAAHRLAGVGATSGPSGGSALDSLFGEGPSAPMPAESPVATITPSRGTVPRASDKLRFDQFFATSTSVEPVAQPAEAMDATPSLASAPVDAEPEEASDLQEEGPGEDDDLDQFQGWLRGLTS